MALLSSFGKQGVTLGLLTRKVDIEDTDHLSKYFVVSEFNPLFTAGKNSVSFNGSALLRDKSEIQIECLDSKGNSLYLEQARSQDSQFTDAAKFVVSVHIYNETYNGPGKLIIIGTSVKGESVRWIGNIAIDKTLDNDSKVRFFYKPTIEARALLYPVVDTDLAQVADPPPPPIRQAQAHVTAISSVVNTITVTNGGTGYTLTDPVTISGGGATTNATARITSVDGVGAITAITVINGGGGYTALPIITVGGGGVGAVAIARLLSKVVSIGVDDGGAGYTSPPSIRLSGIGSGATAVATVVGGSVSLITVTSGGNGYTFIPDVIVGLPPTVPPPDLNLTIDFSGSFFTHAATPVKDTNKNSINVKQTDIDYRLVLTGSTWRPLLPSDLDPTTYPYKAFNTQMEGQRIDMHINRVQVPFSTKEQDVNITASVYIKKVLDAKTIQLSEPYYYTQGKNQLVGHIVEGRCFVEYRLVLYNTRQDSQKTITVEPGNVVPVKASYAEITYRNLKCYSGFVARHKLYRKSSFSPGDFQLISDELLPSSELLFDPVTFNKFYDKIGVFHHQPQINKYWFASSDEMDLQAKTFPINSMRIWRGDDPALIDGNDYVIVKNDSIGVTNDAVYHPYDTVEYNRLSGSSYNSNFISLKKDTQYVLSMNASMEKIEDDTAAKVEFFFTSSIATMRTEKSFSPKYGMKLGEIATKDTVRIKYFKGQQQIFFTPANDYFGTLVIVPYHCNPTLSDVSLKVYGDYGFSPDVLTITIPFSLNVKNEAFDIRAELLDRNSKVVFSNLRTVQTFDASGESLFSDTTQNPVNTVITVTNDDDDGDTVTIAGTPYFPDLTNCDNTTRFVGWHLPTGDTSSDGKLCYTNVSQLYIDSEDYIVIHEFQSGVEYIAKAIAVKYDFSAGVGRKIFIDASGTKETFP